eukprot:15328616-Alexandrium_andersonii.AAC.1
MGLVLAYLGANCPPRRPGRGCGAFAADCRFSGNGASDGELCPRQRSRSLAVRGIAGELRAWIAGLRLG